MSESDSESSSSENSIQTESISEVHSESLSQINTMPKVKPLNLEEIRDETQGRFNRESAFFGVLPQFIVDQVDVKLTKRKALKD